MARETPCASGWAGEQPAPPLQRLKIVVVSCPRGTIRLRAAAPVPEPAGGDAGLGGLDGAGEPPIGLAGFGAMPPEARPLEGGVMGRTGAG